MQDDWAARTDTGMGDWQSQDPPEGTAGQWGGPGVQGPEELSSVEYS